MKIMSTLKLVALLFVVVLKLFVNGGVGCLENERHALLQLKVSLTLNEDASLLTTWDSKSDGCCAWEGIGCNNLTGHVEMFHLSRPQFGAFPGEINASLMELKHLKYLNFSGNQFLNSVFSELFGSLTNLRFLDLRDSFNGGRIPNDISRLSHLQYLDLSRNGLDGTIPQQLGNLSHLQHLDLSWNDYYIGGAIPRQLGNLFHLQYLDLSQNGLEGTIPQQLGNLSHLQHLDLSWNGLVGTIPHQLERLSNLQELNLGDNDRLKFDEKNNHVGGQWLSNLTLLTHLDLSRLPNLDSSHLWLQMIAKLPNIQDLRLSSCDLSDLYLHSLSHSRLNFSTSLAILDLSRNAFSSSKIFEWVFNATSNLIDLDLRYNNFNDTITYDLGNIKNPLEQLDLSENELQGGIPEFIRHMCMLQSLSLDLNNLNEDISTILHKLSGCARYSLQQLSLSNNQITGALPNLSVFPSLIIIDLSSNRLSGKVPEGISKSLESLSFESNYLEGGIPKSFGNLCSLVSLDLSSNKLSEDLSVILHNLSFGCAKDSLQELYLGSNQITGTVPIMTGFSSLVSLNFEHNILEGEITDTHFDNMSMLKDLNLNDNSLSAIFSENWVPTFQLSNLHLRSCTFGSSFPKWLQSQKHLQELDISNARISGVVPMWFWTQATNIRLMNFSYNSLTGTIPNLPIRISEYCRVILESNQFEGLIPLFFHSASWLLLSKNKFSEARLFLCVNTTTNRLRILDISNNQLSGQLPDCWSNLEVLRFLDLSDNTLSGEVPSSMGSLLGLMVLILRNNSFTGMLPLSLKNCTELIMLDVGENKFWGPIPYWLGHQLQMLSLRRNQFYGNLPRSLCYLTNIQLLDLSENNLSGRIFKCIKNFSAMSQNVSSTSPINSVLSFTDRASFVSFDLIALLTWKGTVRQFKNNKLILRSIDLSSNQLIGDIPKEIGNLIELVSLNLSNNKLTGEITSEIGRLTSLEFLDLSRNHLYGLIPPSLAQILRLSMLNLSDNNLSGMIPIGTQLQSFDASSYEGNVGLCGKPLDKNCPGDEKVTPEKPETNEENSPEDKKPIYLSVALGFITGFWGLWGSLFLIRTWRHTYVLFLNNIVDTMYVFMVLNGIKFQRWLRALQEKFF